MQRKKVPLTTIGSAVLGAAGGGSPAMPATTSVQPSAIERAGDTLGRLIFKSVPVVASGALALAREFGSTDGRPKRSACLDRTHPDYFLWQDDR